MGKSKEQQVAILDLKPNNWYINQAKLDNVRKAWQEQRQDKLPPVLVSEIDGSLSLIDGHARTYAAFELGETHIRAIYSDLDQIGGSTALYEHIHREGLNLGIETIADLKDRIIEPAAHERFWVGYCSQWLEDNAKASNGN